MKKQNKKIKTDNEGAGLRGRDPVDEAERLYAFDAEAVLNEFRQRQHIERLR
jgi:hypothetical protein